MCFMEPWFHSDILDSLVSLKDFTLLRANRRMAERGKRKGGALVDFINNRWCNPGHITLKEQLSNC